MKAEELMIGDWVNMPYGETSQMYGSGFSNRTDWFERVQPIPLTTEILEKNGWKHDKIFNNWWNPGVGFVIWYNLMTFQDFYCCEITSMKFDYVHQLQHALRLCGFTDLADNFKI